MGSSLLTRRGFVGLLAAVAACLRFQPEDRYDDLVRQCREVVKQYPHSRTIGMGDKAINCYHDGLVKRYGVVKREVRPASDPSVWMFPKWRVVYVPALKDWDVAAEVELAQFAQLTGGSWTT